MTIGTKIYTAVFGQFAGEDEFGNRYYQSRIAGKNGRRKRWVSYNGIAEASKVPPSWHGWLHYTFDEPLTAKYEWQKPHQPNLTGTACAYMPKGHLLKGGKRPKATGDYEAWKPGSRGRNG